MWRGKVRYLCMYTYVPMYVVARLVSAVSQISDCILQCPKYRTPLQEDAHCSGWGRPPVKVVAPGALWSAGADNKPVLAFSEPTLSDLSLGAFGLIIDNTDKLLTASLQMLTRTLTYKALGFNCLMQWCDISRYIKPQKPLLQGISENLDNNRWE